MCGKCGHPKNECTCKKYDYDYNCYKPKCSDDCDYDYFDPCTAPPQMHCEQKKECVKTFTCFYKLYRVCQYRLYKVCSRCKHEFDYHHHRGVCPRCSGRP